MRKVILSEEQIIRLVDKLVIKEQNIVKTELPSIITTGNTKDYNITNSFQSGQYKLTNTSDIDDAINSIKNDIKDYPQNQKFVVYVEGSESKVPNRGVGLKLGDLSKFRINNVITYLQGKLPQNVTFQPNDRGAQGDEWVQNGNPKDEKYTKWQYVILKLSGLGQKEEKRFEIKEYCNSAPIKSSGGYVSSNSNFTQVSNHIIGKGEGKGYISFDAINMPDILIAEYNNKIYGYQGFSGNNGSENERMLIGTALLNKFGTSSNLPDYFYDTQFEQIQPNDPRLIAALQNEAWGLEDSFINTFGSQGDIPNEQYMNAFRNFDKKKNKSANINSLLRSLGPDFKWGYLTSKIGRANQRFELPKVNGLDTIKVINVSPNGATGWVIKVSCQ
jgi:hypothetical protein